jgi:hypothetical protein
VALVIDGHELRLRIVGIERIRQRAQRGHQVDTLQAAGDAAVEILQSDDVDAARSFAGQCGIPLGVGFLVLDGHHRAQGFAPAMQRQRVRSDAHGDVAHVAHGTGLTDVVHPQQAAPRVVDVVLHPHRDHGVAATISATPSTK